MVGLLDGANKVCVCLVLKKVQDVLHLRKMRFEKQRFVETKEELQCFVSQCVKVVLFETPEGYDNYSEEMLRVERALSDLSKKRKRDNSFDETFVNPKKAKLDSPSSSSSASLTKRRTYKPSSKGQHEKIKNKHNNMLCTQYNEMVAYYKSDILKDVYALFLDGVNLTTQTKLQKQCGFDESHCLVPNPYEYEELKVQKTAGLFNQSLGQLLKSSALKGKHVSFVWFDYMNSLEGNFGDVKAGESTPKQDILFYLKHHAKPYSLFAVTLCLRHSKYTTHDYAGGNEVVVMRFINDAARDNGFYFSIIPPTSSYGSSMFLYAGVLLPL